MSIADTVLLVLVPGLGDDIQALKAGIMEIADIFVVNKADKDGKEKLIAEISMIINLNKHRFLWVPPLVETVATENQGIGRLMDSIADRNVWLSSNGLNTKRDKIINQFKHMAMDRIGFRIMDLLNSKGIIEDWTKNLLEGKSNPYAAMHELDNNLEIIWNKKNK